MQASRPEGPLIPYRERDTTDLIRACSDSDQPAAWQAFVHRYQRPISLSVLRTLRRWGLAAPDIVEDLVQETYLKLCSDRCRQLLRFAIEHPQAVDGYIKTIAANVAHDYIKAQRSLKRGSGIVGQLPELSEPEAHGTSAGGEESIRSAVLLREIDKCLEECTEGAAQTRDRLIFWLHYQQGMTAAAIAAVPAVGLSTKGVESAIFRLTHQVKGRLNTLSNMPERKSRASARGFGRAQSY